MKVQRKVFRTSGHSDLKNLYVISVRPNINRTFKARLFLKYDREYSQKRISHGTIIRGLLKIITYPKNPRIAKCPSCIRYPKISLNQIFDAESYEEKG